jgi:BRCA2, oligonucleotide/oligosaccharide-binding, domain 1
LQCGQRSGVRRITERDDVPSRFIVLIVSAISGKVFELSDGWYAIRTNVDDLLAGLARKGSLQIGSKIAVCGAELSGIEAGAGLNPLDLACNQVHGDIPWAGPVVNPKAAVDNVHLTVHYNGVRPARWVN